MTTQSIAALAIVLLAVLALIISLTSKKKGCGHDCGCAHPLDRDRGAK